MHDCDDQPAALEHPIRRFRRLDAALMAVMFPLAIVNAVQEWLEDLAELLAAHVNWKNRQESPIGVTA